MSLNKKFTDLEKRKNKKKENKKSEGKRKDKKETKSFKKGTTTPRKGNTLNKTKRNGKNFSDMGRTYKKFPKGEYPKPSEYGRPEKGSFDEIPRSRYGPRTTIKQETEVGDATVEVEVTINESILKHIAGCIIAFCCSKIGYKADEKYNAHYAARLLTETIYKHWVNEIPEIDLSLAPAIVWDFIEAGKPKKCGNRIYHFKKISSFDWTNVWSFVNYGFTLGIKGGDTGGYAILDNSWASYTAALGRTALLEIFDDCGKNCGMVPKKDYVCGIKEDDASFFAHLDYTNNSNDVNYEYFWVADGESFRQFGVASLPDKIKTKWLARCSVNGDVTGVGDHTVKVTCPPGAIIWLRMEKNYRGKFNHLSNVKLVYFDGETVVRALDTLAVRIAAQTTWVAFNNALAGYSKFDMRMLVAQILLRHFHQFAGAGNGAGVRVGGVETALTFGNGTGRHPQSYIQTIRDFRVLEESLSRVRPYEVGYTHYVPVCGFIREVEDSIFAASYVANASGKLTTQLLFMTGKVGANEVLMNYVVPSVVGDGMYGFLQVWAKLMGKIAEYAAVSGQIVEDKHNVASVLIKDGSSTTANYLRLLRRRKVDDQFVDVIVPTLLPVLYINGTNEDDINAVAAGWEFRVVESIQVVDNQITLVIDTWMGTVHSAAAFGDPQGAPGSDPEASSYWETAKAAIGYLPLAIELYQHYQNGALGIMPGNPPNIFGGEVDIENQGAMWDRRRAINRSTSANIVKDPKEKEKDKSCETNRIDELENKMKEILKMVS